MGATLCSNHYTLRYYLNHCTEVPLSVKCVMDLQYFRNPSNFDMDYRIFNVRTRSFWCVRIHTGVGHTDSESAQYVWLGKAKNKLLYSCRGSNSGHWCHGILSPMLYQLNHPVTPEHWTARTAVVLLFECNVRTVQYKRSGSLQWELCLLIKKAVYVWTILGK